VAATISLPGTGASTDRRDDAAGNGRQAASDA
jgi:hypothetical protein